MPEKTHPRSGRGCFGIGSYLPPEEFEQARPGIRR